MTGVSFRWGKRLEGLIADLSDRLGRHEAACAEAKEKRERRWLEVNDRIEELTTRVKRMEVGGSKLDRSLMKDLVALEGRFDRAQASRPPLTVRYEPVPVILSGEPKCDDCGSDFVKGMFFGGACILAGVVAGSFIFT